jgi:hypothetical protein
MGSKDRKNKLPPFVPLLIDTLNRPAWRALSHGAQMLYVALRRRYNFTLHNNGKIYLSQRKAAEELNSHHNQIARWFRELQYYGFIVLCRPGYLGVEGKGIAPRWRLTELGYMRDFPTRDYEKWDGTPFVDKKNSRARKTARSVAGNSHSDVRENRPTDRETVQSNAHRGNEDQCDGKHAQNYVTTPIAPPTAAPIKQASKRARLQPRNRDAPLAGGAASMPSGPPGGRAHVEARSTAQSQMHPAKYGTLARVPRRDRKPALPDQRTIARVARVDRISLSSAATDAPGTLARVPRRDRRRPIEPHD